MTDQIDTGHNREQLAVALRSKIWVIACLCAEWCGSCRDYASAFLAWAERCPEHHFIWLDIEDQADLIGDLDIDNFPTLLMQCGPTVSFFGPMKPDTRLAERLLQAQMAKSHEEREREACSSDERRAWQDYNLLARLDHLSNKA